MHTATGECPFAAEVEGHTRYPGVPGSADQAQWMVIARSLQR